VEALNRYYGIETPIRWYRLPARLMGRRVTPHWFYTALALPTLLRLRPDFVYSRNYALPASTSRLAIPTAAETHAWPENSEPAFRLLLKATHHRGFRRCVTISHRLAEQYAALGAQADKIRVLADAVDLRLFERPDAMERHPSPYGKVVDGSNASTGGPHVVYAGHLYDYKGIPAILDAAVLLPDVRFHLVGGLPADIERHAQTIRERALSNVTLHGLKPYADVPPYLWHADVLLLPPSARHPSAAWTSPVKLGEYLASGAPVIATDIPALRDWLSDGPDGEVRFVAPDDGAALAEGIRHILADPATAGRLSRAARRKAARLTYEGRAAAILEDAL
jgi:glycosyltransferase involved in cell wall biosynthesis